MEDYVSAFFNIYFSKNKSYCIFPCIGATVNTEEPGWK